MSLGLALDAAISGLNVSQSGMAALSRNIANVNTRGYSRQIAQQETQIVAGVGVGAKLGPITRAADDFIINQSRDQFTELGRYSAINEYFNRIKIFYGQPEQKNSISDALNEFFTSINTLSGSPDQVFLRSDTVTKGNELARRISSLANNLQKSRFDIDQDIKTSVDKINESLTQLKDVNLAIQTATSQGQSKADLFDKRDIALRTIAEQLDINVNYDEMGRVLISTPSGIELLSNNTYKVSYKPSGTVSNFIDNSPLAAINVILLDREGGETTSVQQLVTSGTPDKVTTQIRTGRMKGLLEMRDKEIPQLLDQLDMMASTFQNEFNKLHNDGSGFPAANSLTGTRSMLLSDRRIYTGTVMIGAVGSNGKAVTSAFPNDYGVRPLKLDLASLDSGFGAGQPDVQTIIDEINWHYGPPSPRVNLQNMADIKLAATSDSAVTGGNFSFNFELDNDTANLANVQVTGIVITGGGGAVTGSLNTSVLPGDKSRKGAFTANALGGAGPWDISATIQVTDVVTGQISTDTITWRITPAASGLRNDRYTTTDLTRPVATIVNPTNNNRIARAELVNEFGVPVGPGQPGFLKISAEKSGNGISIDEMTSAEAGIPLSSSTTATGRGFSHFFELNNFFVRNKDDALKNSAINMKVRSDVIANTSFFTTGELAQATQPADNRMKPNYTFELGVGGNQISKKMFDLQTKGVTFKSTGTLPQLTISIANYTGEIYGFAVNKTNSTLALKEQQQLLFDGLDKRKDEISSVNIDEELANLVQLQKAYESSAKIISSVGELFDALLGAVN